MITCSRRDWFGLAGFEPGLLFKTDRLYLLNSVGSTSDFLLGRQEPALGRSCRWTQWGWQAGGIHLIPAPKRPHAGTVVVARRQPSGRGRQGRTWLDVGGLQMSWTVQVSRDTVKSGLAVWTGLMVAMVLSEHFSLLVQLKWPNDLLIDGRKVGGLILDSPGQGSGGMVVAGLGINLVTPAGGFPAPLHGRATSLHAESGRRVRPANVAGPVLSRLAQELPAFAEGGWAVFTQHLQRHDWLRDRRVEYLRNNERFEGLACGIDVDGALLLVDPTGQTERVLAGEVHLVASDRSGER
ncbi:MAG: biotin--[acetyl-CoA-carboxylase] ligase [bacterium]